MRIGMLVDGQAEYRSLPDLIPRIRTPNTLINPLYADIQPFAPVGQIAHTICTKLPVLAAKKAECALILIDRETRDTCPGEIAANLAARLQCHASTFGLHSIQVVIKDRTFENWLLSDVSALAAFPVRFEITDSTERAILRGVDRLDGAKIFRQISAKSEYEKIKDAKRILAKADPDKMGKASRSFRRMLRVVGHPDYLDQSIRPNQ
jgi:Domain of unknown function (DUF4276)